MQRFLTLLFFIGISYSSKAQNSFSFNCTKDTIIECTKSCININTNIPDIHSSTSTYSAQQLSAISCFRGYVNPATAGLSANLIIDDRYSPPLNIGFPFSFFGTTYNQLIASTNGFLSFDISKTGKFSHFGILKNGTTLSATSGIPEDLPSSLYDRALIMGPYHDLDPNNAISSQQIKYEVIGTAPYRKWIISYYNVPLYTTACLDINKNTHQIVLYETLGIVEVFIYDKGICLNWNNGRSIIGMQDFNRSSVVMAPGRKASSIPWGIKGMNESWRFIPATGTSLFKKVELYTVSGNFVTTGITSAAANNLLNVSFNNVCPPSTGETYIVKSFYQNPSNPAEDIIGTDTINVSRGDPISANIIPATCAQSNKGQITITSPLGNYEYSLDGITWQTSPVFILPAGTYKIKSRIIGSNCISSKTVSIETESFEATVKIIVSPCPPPATGSIEIFPVHGTPPYLYSLNAGTLQTSNIFTGLLEGNYTVFVQDAIGCTYTTIITIANSNLASAAITNTICGKPPSGSITVTPHFGFSPYNYSINGGTSFQNSNVFNNLSAGNYSIIVRDSILCTYTINVTVDADVILYINPSITFPDCFGNTNGKITVYPSLGNPPYRFALDSGQYQNDNVFKNLSAGNYNLHVKDTTGCIKDSSIIVQQPNPVGGTPIIIPAGTCLTYDGQVTIKANGGTVPYEFSIDSGKTYQASNIFNVKAGIFSIIIKDTNNCRSTISDTIPAINSKIIVKAAADKTTICLGTSSILSVSSSEPITNFSWSPSGTLNNSASLTPKATPSDTTTYIVTAKSIVCEGTDSIKINVLHKPIANAGPDTTICNNGFATLHGSASNVSGNVKYLWSPSKGIVNPDSATTIVYPKDIRANAYILQVSDAYGCNFKSLDEVRVTMNPPVHAFAGNDTTASIGIPHRLLGSGGVKYLWTPADHLDDPHLQNPLAILQNDTRFFLTVKDILGCAGTSSVLVKVYKEATYYIPNAFTPNGDGLNDVFKVIAPGIQQTYYFRIFNRWGQLMFETNDITRGWDGTYHNDKQPTAVYVWIIKGLNVLGKIIQLKGTVTLVR